MWTWDWTIRATDMITIGGAFLVALSIFYRRGSTETKITDAVQAAMKEISEIKTEMNALKIVITKIAVQETQIGFLMKWYDELRRGKGYIHDDGG